MGLEINKKGLSGSALNAVECSITAADKDKNGISQEEVSVFATELKKYKDAGWLSKKEYKQVIDSLEITDETAKAKEAPTVTITTKKEKRQADREAKTDAKRNENTTLRALGEVAVAGTEREDLISKLNDKLGTNSEQENFIELKETIKKVIEESKNLDYKDLKDINKNERDLRKALKSEKIDDKVLNQIIDAVNASIKTELVTEAYGKVIEIYNVLKEGKNKNPDKHTLDSLTKGVINTMIAQGLITKEDVTVDANGNYKLAEGTAYAEAMKLYEAKVMRPAAGEIWLDTLVDQDIETKKGKVKRDTIQQLKDAGQYDSRVKDYANSKFGDDISGRAKVKNLDSEIKARFNHVRQQSIQTKDEILNVLGKKSEVFDALVGQEIITKREDGSYDISKLQAELIKQIGADAKVNQHAKIDEAIGEIRAALTKAQDLTKLNSLTDDELKDLFKLCGFPVESKVNFGEVMKGLVNGLLVGTLSGAGAFALTPISVDPTPLDVNVDVNLIGGSKLSGATLPDELIGSVIETETGVTVNIKGLIGGVSGLANLLKYIGPVAYKAALIGGAIGLLGGLTGNGKGGEVPITRLKTEEETLDEYVERVKDENPEYAEVFEMFAKAFVKEDGNWDRTGYRGFLDEIAGSDKLNRDELRSRLINYKDNLKNTPVDEKQDDKKDEVNNGPEKNEVIGYEYNYNTSKEVKVPTTDGKKTSWPKLAQQYECLVENYGLSDAIRMLKIAQAITDGDYSEERLVELLNTSRKGASHMKNIEGLDYDTYDNVLHATLLSAYEYDEDGKIKEGTGVKVPDVLAGCKKIEKDTTAEKSELATNIVASKGHKADTISIPESHWIGLLIVDGKLHSSYSDNEQADMNKEFAELKKNDPNAKIEKITNTEEAKKILKEYKIQI